jgi:HAD superfamily hydrolase (TIGR01484 family)
MLIFVTISYREIPANVSRSLRLIMSDVDGTLTAGGEHFRPEIINTIQQLEDVGIMVGLVSGRTLPRLQQVARVLSPDGPLIAENGGVAQLRPGDGLVDLGYSRQTALDAVEKLKVAFFGEIQERKDNIDRMVDVSINTGTISLTELKKVAPDVQISDSGYMVHVMAIGISKGYTLQRILHCLNGGLKPEEVMVCGDSPTDISLFEYFNNGVWIRNPQLSDEHLTMMAGAASYRSDRAIDAGFIEVAEHIIQARQSKR